MVIFDLSYLEDVSEAASVVGGDCSVEVSIVNGKATTKKSPGCSASNVTSNISVTTYSTDDGVTEATAEGSNISVVSVNSGRIIVVN